MLGHFVMTSVFALSLLPPLSTPTGLFPNTRTHITHRAMQDTKKMVRLEKDGMYVEDGKHERDGKSWEAVESMESMER